MVGGKVMLLKKRARFSGFVSAYRSCSRLNGQPPAPGPEPVPAQTGKPAAGKLLKILN